MKYLLCGTLVPAKYEIKIKHLSNAGNRFLMNFCDELKKKHDLEVLSYIGISVDKNVRYLMGQEKIYNLHITYNFMSKYRLAGVLKYLYRVKSQLKQSDCLIAYNPVYAWLAAPLWAHNMKKKSILILADYTPKAEYKNVLKKLYAQMQLWSIRNYDFVIGLSEKSRVYTSEKQKFICIEGGIAQTFFDYYTEKKQKKQKVTIFHYAGLLEAVTGIDTLIKAFHQMPDENIILRISGKGIMKNWIEQMSKMDSRIQFLGCLVYEEYMSILQDADVLVNPRNMALPENANNFPSKIMEYLATGKTIVSTKFPGWERYVEYISFCEDSTIEGLMKELECAVQNAEEQTQDMFAKQREFARQFMWKEQVLKFCSFID